MQAKALKWGNSLALRIPSLIARECGIEENTPVEIKRRDNEIVVIPLRREYSLDEMLARVTPENVQHEVSFGRPSGRELL